MKAPSGRSSSAVFDAFMEHQAAIRHFIARFMVRRQDIDEISQETFLRAYRAEKEQAIRQPKAFLFRIAKNLVLSEFSRKSTRITDYIDDFEYERILGESETLESSVIAQQKLGVLCETVATLPGQCRRVFLMRKVYGMSHGEISNEMGISVSTVEKHLAKAVRQCTAVMAERFGEDEMSPAKAIGRNRS